MTILHTLLTIITFLLSGTPLFASQAQQHSSLFYDRQTNVTNVSNVSTQPEDAPPFSTSSISSNTYTDKSSFSEAFIPKPTGPDELEYDIEYDLKKTAYKNTYAQTWNTQLDPLQKHIASEVYKAIMCFPQEIANIVAQYASNLKGNLIATFQGFNLVTLPNGYLASGSGDTQQAEYDWMQPETSIKIWSPGTDSNGNTIYQCIQTLTKHYGTTSLAALPNGYLASGSRGAGIIRIWSPSTNPNGQTVYQCTQTLTHKKISRIYALVALPNGYLVSLDPGVKIWSPEIDSAGQTTYKCIQTFSSGTTLIVLPNGYFALGGDDYRDIEIWAPVNYQTIMTTLWSLVAGTYGKTTYKCNQTLTQSKFAIGTFAALSNGSLALGTYDKLCAREDTIEIWSPVIDSNESTKYQYSATLRGHTDSVNTLLALPHGLLASGSRDSSIKIWSPSTNSKGQITYQCIQTLSEHKLAVNALVLLSNGCLASGSTDSSIKIWSSKINSNGQTIYQCIQTLQGCFDQGIYNLTTLPNNCLAARFGDNTIKIWQSNS